MYRVNVITGELMNQDAAVEACHPAIMGCAAACTLPAAQQQRRAPRPPNLPKLSVPSRSPAAAPLNSRPSTTAPSPPTVAPRAPLALERARTLPRPPKPYLVSRAHAPLSPPQNPKGNVRGAGTNLPAYIQLIGSNGTSEKLLVGADDGFPRGSTLTFEAAAPKDIGEIRRCFVARAKSGYTNTGDGWFLEMVEVQGPHQEVYQFPCHGWFGHSDCGDYVGERAAAADRGLLGRSGRLEGRAAAWRRRGGVA